MSSHNEKQMGPASRGSKRSSGSRRRARGESVYEQ